VTGGSGAGAEITLSVTEPGSRFPALLPREGRLRPRDLDGDGRAEWLLVPETGGPVRVEVVAL
jgi:hypothetical protein